MSANGRVRDDEFMVGRFSERPRIVYALEMTLHVVVVPRGAIFGELALSFFLAGAGDVGG